MKDLSRTDGEPMEFEWKVFSGFTTLGILEEIQHFMKEIQCEPCQCTTTLYGRTRKHRTCENNSVTVANYARRFPRGRWLFLGLGSEKKWYGTYSDKPVGK